MNRFSIIILTILVASAFCNGCKEKGPLIEFGNKIVLDTNYIDAIAAAQLHNVLVEEFTGASCTNCPKQRDQLKAINEAKDHRLVIMGIHFKGISQSNPAEGSKYDFRTDEGTSIKDNYFGDLQGIPASGFDRVKVNGESALLPASWAKAIDDRLAKPTPVNIELVPTFKEADHKLDLEVKISYTQQLIGLQKISLVIIEDSLIDKQEFPSEKVQDDYVFMHTFRDYLTTLNGDPFLETLQ